MKNLLFFLLFYLNQIFFKGRVSQYLQCRIADVSTPSFDWFVTSGRSQPELARLHFFVLALLVQQCHQARTQRKKLVISSDGYLIMSLNSASSEIVILQNGTLWLSSRIVLQIKVSGQSAEPPKGTRMIAGLIPDAHGPSWMNKCPIILPKIKHKKML